MTSSSLKVIPKMAYSFLEDSKSRLFLVEKVVCEVFFSSKYFSLGEVNMSLTGVDRACLSPETLDGEVTLEPSLNPESSFGLPPGVKYFSSIFFFKFNGVEYKLKYPPLLRLLFRSGPSMTESFCLICSKSSLEAVSSIEVLETLRRLRAIVPGFRTGLTLFPSPFSLAKWKVAALVGLPLTSPVAPH